MTAPSKNWTNILDTQIDADSPFDTTLLTEIRDNLVNLKEWLGLSYTAAQNHSHDGANSAKILEANLVRIGAVQIYDDFLLDAIVGWTNVGGTTVLLTAANNGWARTNGDNTMGARGIWSAARPFQVVGNPAMKLVYETRVKDMSTNANEYLYGLTDAFNTTNPSNVIAFMKIGPTFYACTFLGAVQTKTALGFMPSTTPMVLRIEATSTSVSFYKDGTLVATHTTNIPTTNLAPIAAINVTDAAAPGRSYDVDYIQCYSDTRL